MFRICAMMRAILPVLCRDPDKGRQHLDGLMGWMQAGCRYSATPARQGWAGQGAPPRPWREGRRPRARLGGTRISKRSACERTICAPAASFRTTAPSTCGPCQAAASISSSPIRPTSPATATAAGAAWPMTTCRHIDLSTNQQERKVPMSELDLKSGLHPGRSTAWRSRRSASEPGRSRPAGSRGRADRGDRRDRASRSSP
jgi:hypothetical protein